MEPGLRIQVSKMAASSGRDLSPGEERRQTGELELTETPRLRMRADKVESSLSWRAWMRCAGPGGSFPFLDGQTINFLIGSGADAACSSLSPVDSSASTNST